MSRVVFTKETQDFTTGEIIQKEIFRKHVDNQEQFVRTYIKDIGALAKCSGAEQSFVLCSLKYLDYATNEFILTTERRKEICECGNIKLNTLNSAVSRLVKKNLLIRKSENMYILNPVMFFYGKDIDRAEVIKATITYVIGSNARVQNKEPILVTEKAQ